MMRIVDFLSGVVVLFMGLLPFLTRIEAIAERFAFIKEPGTTTYQVVLIIVGILLILYAIRSKKK
jgi:hypothetical protein